uniref:Centromere protein M n=1 Tax=Monodelphis domestica TaxID=13616 RepID=A0A5F8GYK1_MONDO
TRILSFPSFVYVLVGAEEKLLEQLGEAVLREGEGSAKVQVHVAPGLPLPADRECLRPRVDLVVFVLSLHSKHSLRTVEASLPQLDAGFFLGKVCFLASGGERGAEAPPRPPVPWCFFGGGGPGRGPPDAVLPPSQVGSEQKASIHTDAVARLAATFRSPLLFGDLEVRTPPGSTLGTFLAGPSETRGRSLPQGASPRLTPCGEGAPEVLGRGRGTCLPTPEVGQALRGSSAGHPTMDLTAERPCSISWAGNPHRDACCPASRPPSQLCRP